MTHGPKGTFPGINFEPPYDPRTDPEMIRRRKIEKAAAIGGTAVGVPGYLYARGVRDRGVPWKGVPGILGETFKKSPSTTASIGNVVGTMYEGLRATGRDVKGLPGRTWGGTKNIWGSLRSGFQQARGIAALSAKLDELIQMEERRIPPGWQSQIPVGQLPTFVVRRTTYIKKDDEKDRKVPAPALLGAGGIAGAGIATGSAATRQLFKVGGRKIQRIARQIRRWK